MYHQKGKKMLYLQEIVTDHSEETE